MPMGTLGYWLLGPLRRVLTWQGRVSPPWPSRTFSVGTQESWLPPLSFMVAGRTMVCAMQVEQGKTAQTIVLPATVVTRPPVCQSWTSAFA